MEIGKLNQRITFLEHSTKIDNIGNHKAQWDEAFSCWAAVSVKSSAENSDNGTTKEVLSLEFTVNIDSILPNYKSLVYMKITAGTRKTGDCDGFC